MEANRMLSGLSGIELLLGTLLDCKVETVCVLRNCGKDKR